MPVTPAGQTQIEAEIREWMYDALSNSAAARDSAAWNAFFGAVPDLAAQVYNLVSTAGYAGAGGNQVKTGTITATGPTADDATNAAAVHGDFNLSVWSTDPLQPWTGRVRVERSFDNGATWVPVMHELWNQAGYSLRGSFSIALTEPEADVLYRLNCDELKTPNEPDNAGATYRFSQ